METIEIRIDSLSHGGAGVGRHEGIVYFVPFSVPGDLLEIQITKTEKRYREAEIVRIIEPSPDRKEPPCPYFGQCGGCDWQNITYEKQVEAKVQSLHSALAKNRLGAETGKILPVIKSPQQYNYRRTARFKIGLTDDGRTAAGFYRAASRNMIAIERCMLLDEKINKSLLKVEINKEGLRGVDLFLDRDGTVKPFYRFSEKDPGADFVQVNPGVNDRLVEHIAREVRTRLGKNRVKPGKAKILDLYCGDGNLSLQFADTAEVITGWDSCRTAVERGRIAAEKLTSEGSSCRIKFFEADVAHSWKKIADFAAHADCLILDPPRRGLKDQAERLARLNIPLIIYISCSPPDLVRDLVVLTESGYKIESLQPLDMFPQTWHIETVAVLSR